MDNSKTLFEGLLKADGIDPAGATESERTAFGKMLDEQSKSNESKPGSRHDIWRIIMKSKITKFVAAAVIIIAVLFGISLSGVDSTSEAFAKAVNSVTQAKTFSCIETWEAVGENGREIVLEQEWMFKEPDLRRHTYVSGVDEKFIGEVTITHYGQRQQLTLRPSDKTAMPEDKSSDYVINSNTGELELSQLDTSLRERLLTLRMKAVKDLGEAIVDGYSVRILQSRTDNQVTTVWVDPESGLPVQIEIEYEDRFYRYASIIIDEVLSADLFSLEPPNDYRLKIISPGWPVYKKKVCAKIMHLLRECAVFAAQNSNQYPQNLAELESTGMTIETLKVILSAPDHVDGLAAIKYIQPRQGTDRSIEIVMHEVYDEWPKDGIVVGFADCHCELISNQQTFKGLFR